MFQLRAAILKCPLSELPYPFKDFLHGAYGGASEALEKFLGNNGFGTFYHVSGWKGGGPCKGSSHAWLVKEGIIIDITGSQFNGRWPEVPQVAEVVVTNNRDFHQHFIEVYVVK